MDNRTTQRHNLNFKSEADDNDPEDPTTAMTLNIPLQHMKLSVCQGIRHICDIWNMGNMNIPWIVGEWTALCPQTGLHMRMIMFLHYNMCIQSYNLSSNA